MHSADSTLLNFRHRRTHCHGGGPHSTWPEPHPRDAGIVRRRSHGRGHPVHSPLLDMAWWVDRDVHRDLLEIILIFVLILNTLTSRKRLEQFVWLIVLASGYIALRAVMDAGRGINMVENGRVRGAVGGMFRNPNDLALNMVAVMPLAVSLALRSGTLLRRGAAVISAVLMVGAIVASQSRSGTIGLLMMALILGVQMVRRAPGVAFAGVLALLLALPLVPGAYWHRLSSITDESRDDTGSVVRDRRCCANRSPRSCRIP